MFCPPEAVVSCKWLNNLKLLIVKLYLNPCKYCHGIEAIDLCGEMHL